MTRPIVVKKNTLSKDIEINGIRIASGMTGEFQNKPVRSTKQRDNEKLRHCETCDADQCCECCDYNYLTEEDKEKEDSK